MTHAHTADRLLRHTTRLMLGVDIGFLLYWALITTNALPTSVMFAHYADASVAAWNWSFLPLDLVASATGLAAFRALRAKGPTSTALLVMSLSLTATAGGMALAYWAVQGLLDLTWWLPNAFLLLFPIPLLVRLARTGPNEADHQSR